MTTTPSFPQQDRLAWLDYLRFASALAVMLFHYFANAARRGKIEDYGRFGTWSDVAEYGYLGVDVFFIISGFVIYLTTRDRDATRFAVSRAVRLWPTFALCMTLTAVAGTLSGQAGFEVSFWRWLVNLTMLSRYVHVPYVDSVYWTLGFEIAFYAAVFLVLLWRIRTPMETLARWWLLPLVLGIAVEWQTYRQIPLANGYHALFALGILLGELFTRGYTRARIAWIALAFGVCALGAWVRTDAISAHNGVALSQTVVIGFLALTVLVFLVFSAPRLARLALPGSKLMGQMTYPLYLLHSYLGYVLINELSASLGSRAAIGVVAAGMLSLSYLVVVLWEEPTRNAWRRFFTAMLGPLVARLQPGGRSAAAHAP